MEAYERWRLTGLVMAMNRISQLLVELLKGVGLGVNGSTNSLSSKRTVFGLLHQKKDLVHGHRALLQFWIP